MKASIGGVERVWSLACSKNQRNLFGYERPSYFRRYLKTENIYVKMPRTTRYTRLLHIWSTAWFPWYSHCRNYNPLYSVIYHPSSWLGASLNSRSLMSVTGDRTFWRTPRRNRFSGRMRLQARTALPHCFVARCGHPHCGATVLTILCAKPLPDALWLRLFPTYLYTHH